ncbi:type II toxin-antitoxin system Phd/YefM family antitoxin [Candidatus Poriferisocius sp.]|uniref:type II toxin-antitoxin system Phd/YefM family antitoxin n=1 Tax=Candidatus Poriferisocius sp. TaxID=3101276 RepID=UPI003B02A474
MSTIARPAVLPDSIPFSEFRANCSRILDQVEKDGDAVTVTKNGRPVAVVTPCPKQPTSFWDRYSKLIKIEPGADIDNMGEEEWGVDWCPTHEVTG